MGLMDTLRRAEEQGRKAARWGMEQAIVSLDDAERAIRRRMRIYPQQMAAAQSAAAQSATQRQPEVPAAPAMPHTSDIPVTEDIELQPEDSESEGRKIA